MTFLTDIAAAQRKALQRFGVLQIGDVEGEPITLEDGRAQCNLDVFGSPPESEHDFWLETVGIPAARQYCENYKGVAYAPRIMEIASNAFPASEMNLPFGPVQSITSVVYLDTDGVEQTMDAADYTLDLYSTPARLLLAYGATWPAARDTTNSVKVRYATGYSLPDASPIAVLPPLAKAAMLLMVGHLFANREGVVMPDAAMELPLGVKACLDLAPNGERIGFA